MLSEDADSRFQNKAYECCNPYIICQAFGYEEEEKGYYSGLVASSVFAGRLLGRYGYNIGYTK